MTDEKSIGERFVQLLADGGHGFPDVGDVLEDDGRRYRVVEILDHDEGQDVVEATLEFLGQAPYRGEYED